MIERLDHLRPILNQALERLATRGQDARVFYEFRDMARYRTTVPADPLEYGRDEGFCLQVTTDEGMWSCHVDGCDPSALLAAAAGSGGDLATVPAQRLCLPDPPPPATADWLRSITTVRVPLPGAARVDTGVRITRRLIASQTERGFRHDCQQRCRFSAWVTVTGRNRPYTAHHGVGLRSGAELTSDLAAEVLEQAAHMAASYADPQPVQPGPQPVVLGPGAGGFLFHEACGHSLEADHVRAGTSPFRHRLGQRIAPEWLTVIDDGTVAGGWGSSECDDEGTAAQRTVLVRDGILTMFMTDLDTARSLDLPATGNGRRASYRHLPAPRMTNTFIAAGKATPSAIISNVDSGLYVSAITGGRVDPVTGQFEFTIGCGRLIQSGQLEKPVRNIVVSGDGPSTLLAVEAAGSDFELAPADCGKGGQHIPVGLGQPTIALSQLMIR